MAANDAPNFRLRDLEEIQQSLKLQRLIQERGLDQLINSNLSHYNILRRRFAESFMGIDLALFSERQHSAKWRRYNVEWKHHKSGDLTGTSASLPECQQQPP